MDCDANFLDVDDAVPLTHLYVYYFFEEPSGKVDHLIGNDNVQLSCYFISFIFFMFNHITYLMSTSMFTFSLIFCMYFEDKWINLWRYMSC